MNQGPDCGTVLGWAEPTPGIIPGIAAGSGVEESATYAFALPAVELDGLPAHLAEWAREVTAAQHRLCGLLRANQLVSSDLSASGVLAHIVEAARGLIGARYAAVGVVAPDGKLAEFIHSGVPSEVAERIGQLPQGRGLLGAVIEEPEPIRLRHIAEDPRSCGFPVGHPPMDSFLAVPLRVRDDVLGSLYLAEAVHGRFTSEDEQLAEALATAAAQAIDNARRYQDSRTRQEWLRASSVIDRGLLSGETTDPGQLIAELARRIAGANLVSITRLVADGAELQVTAAAGNGAGGLVGRRLPRDGSLLGQVHATGEPMRVAQPPPWPAPTSVALTGPDVGPVLLVPMRGSERTYGVLTAARAQGGSAFSAEDVDMATGFANQAAVAIELAEARAALHSGTVADERDRIAADLHRNVIHRLFAAGLSLQSAAAGLGSTTGAESASGTANHIGTAIGMLDDTITELRATVYRLRDLDSPGRADLPGRLLDVVTDMTAVLGFTPSVRIAAALADRVPDGMGEDLVVALREALANIVRHAHASSVDVAIAVHGSRLSLNVTDDGVGMGADMHHRGLADLQALAERHGGTVDISPRDSSGTRVAWSAPV